MTAPAICSVQTDLFTFRPAERADIPLILTFIRELAEYEKLAHEVSATEEGLAHTLFGPKAYAEVLLAYIGENPAGFCLFFHNYSTFLGKPGIYIEDIFVREAYRAGGIGSAFFKEVARIARARDCGRIEWWVLDWNTPATTFYKKLGAIAMDEWTVWRLSEETFSTL